MKKKSRSKSELALKVVDLADLLVYGRVLSVDPSSGSSGSMPGYARIENNVLLDYGTVALPKGSGSRPLNERLFLLRKTLEASFERPDVLIIEKISPGMGFGKAGGFSATARQSALIKSVGVVMSVWDCPVLEVSPQTWRARVDLERYKKGDAQDAITLWAAARQVLEEQQGWDVSPMVYIV